MTDVKLADVELWKKVNCPKAYSWLDCNQAAKQVVTDALNNPQPNLRTDAVRDQLKMNINMISMFGDPTEDPLLTGLFGADDRDELLDKNDQVKLYDALMLVQQQIGRMALGRDEQNFAGTSYSSSSSSSSSLHQRYRKSQARRSFAFDLNQNFVVMPDILHPLMKKIQDQLVAESDKSFFKYLAVALYNLLDLVPPYDRTNRESWMHFLGGLPTKVYEPKVGYEWTTNAQEMLLRFMSTERKGEQSVTDFLVQLIEVDLAAQYVRATTKGKNYKATKFTEPPGKRHKVESDLVTVFTNNPKAKKKEEDDDTDDLGYNNRIPSLFPIALILIRPKPAEYKKNRRDNKFLISLCEGFFQPNETATAAQILYARLLMVCMDALAEYGTLSKRKVAAKAVEQILDFDDIEPEMKVLIKTYISIIVEYMDKHPDGGLLVRKYIPLTWLNESLLELSVHD